MKVIIIKDFENFKTNQIIEVSNGYAKNFLIRKGYAKPFNSVNKKQLEQVLKKSQEIEEANIKEAETLKKQIESVSLLFELKKAKNKETVHRTISKKQIKDKLKKENKIDLPPHAISAIHLNTFGIHQLKLKLYKNIVATLKIEVRENVK